jgi:predicted RNA-binding protein Jag
MATKYIEYELDENEIVKIPREEVERIQKGLGVSEDDACWIWCEDNGKVINEEQEALTKKAKDNRITATIHQARAETTKERKKPERKPDETKESIIAGLAEYLAEIVENVKVTNVGKIIEFDLKGEHYKLDLIRQRKPKK